MRVLLKPCTLLDLQNILPLAGVDRHHLPVLDDNIALSASGTPAVVQALRGLFQQELMNIYQELTICVRTPAYWKLGCISSARPADSVARRRYRSTLCLCNDI